MTIQTTSIAVRIRRACAAGGLAALLAGIGGTALPAAASVCTGCDVDDDGLSNGAEQEVYFTDLTRFDTDGDGLGDGEEVFLGGANPLSNDTEGDTAEDRLEYIFGADPRNADTDGDGIADGTEWRTGTDPLVRNAAPAPAPAPARSAGSDGDGIPAADETSEQFLARG